MKLTRRDILAMILGGAILILSLQISGAIYNYNIVNCNTYEEYFDQESHPKYFDPNPDKQIEIFKDEHGRGFVSATYDEETDILTECFNTNSEKFNLIDFVRENKHD